MYCALPSNTYHLISQQDSRFKFNCILELFKAIVTRLSRTINTFLCQNSEIFMTFEICFENFTVYKSIDFERISITKLNCFTTKNTIASRIYYQASL